MVKKEVLHWLDLFDEGVVLVDYDSAPMHSLQKEGNRILAILVSNRLAKLVKCHSWCRMAFAAHLERLEMLCARFGRNGKGTLLRGAHDLAGRVIILVDKKECETNTRENLPIEHVLHVVPLAMENDIVECDGCLVDQAVKDLSCVILV